MPHVKLSVSDFSIISRIGSGSFGSCSKVKRKSDGKIYVWKEIRFGHVSVEEKLMIVREVNVLRTLQHDYVVQYHDRIIDRHAKIIYIVMEYCSGGDLAHRILDAKLKRLPFDNDFLWRLSLQLGEALYVCHTHSGGCILHRDIKPANVFLLSSGCVKLGDFGLAKQLPSEQFANTLVGTPYYMSPEVFKHEPYNHKSDIWSYGCVLYEACSLSKPFTASRLDELGSRVRNGRYDALPKHVPTRLNIIIQRLLTVQHSVRPGIEEVMRLLMRDQPTPCHRRQVPKLAGNDNHMDWRNKLAIRRDIELVRRERGFIYREKRLVNKENVFFSPQHNPISDEVRKRKISVGDADVRVTPVKRRVLMGYKVTPKLCYT